MFVITLTYRREIAKETLAFYFEKPQGFVFKAGQTLVLSLINPRETDSEGNARTFSLASAPYEDTLLIATRMRNTAFKRTLKTIELPAQINAAGPYGLFTLHDDQTIPAVFLAGGIGITPFRSMLRQATRDKTNHKFFLFYANPTQEEAAFLQELTELEKRSPIFRFIPLVTHIDTSDKTWKGETSYISKEMLTKYVPDLLAPEYYIAGPPDMVNAVRTTLLEVGISEEKIKNERFTGY